MGANCCGCCQSKRRTKNEPTKTAKIPEKTVTGKYVNQGFILKLRTQEELEQLKKGSFELQLIFSPPMNRFDKITDYVFLTGFGGINYENIKNNEIKHLIDVTHDLPINKVPGLDSMKIAIDDDISEDIFEFFDNTTDLMNEWVNKKEPVVVHCMCGISRSSTIVIAYLMKYKEMSLKDAFEYVYQIREIIRPNNGFLRQLVKYEKILKKVKNLTKMIQVRSYSNEKQKLPEFFVKNYPKLADASPSDSLSDASTQSYLSVLTA